MVRRPPNFIPRKVLSGSPIAHGSTRTARPREGTRREKLMMMEPE